MKQWCGNKHCGNRNALLVNCKTYKLENHVSICVMCVWGGETDIMKKI